MSTMASKPVIFLAFANSSANPLPILAEEYHRLEAIAKQAEQKRHCELVVAPYATVDDILGTFQDEHYRGRIAIFHYAGHADSYELLLQDAGGQPVVADAGGLATFLGHQTGLQLVFLNGCSTQPQAQGLLDAGAAVVIATSQAIDDQVATDFAARFYQFLADGDAIDVAFEKAQTAVQTTRGSNTRHLYAIKDQDARIANRWPWDRYVRLGAEAALRWNLPDAANDPFFGLPPIAEKYYQRLPDNPFRGLTWFATEHAALFYGRGYQIRALYQQIVAPHTPPLILFYGQSGVGKSSLLAAGLAPRLENSDTFVYLRRDQQQGLLGTLQAALADKAGATPLADTWAASEAHNKRPLLVILDQAEEVFTRPNPDQPHELADFLAAVQALGADPERWPQGRLILGFRKEWLAEVKRQVEEHKLPYTELFLQRLDQRGVIEAITGPTQLPALQAKYRLAVAGELPRLIADDLLADPGSAVAPTLQILLTKLWEAAKVKSYDQPTLDAELYAELRKQGLGLGDILDQQLAELDRRQPEVVASGLALDLLAFHTTPLGTAEERTREGLRQTYTHLQEVLEPLVQECGNLYLLVDPAKNEPTKPPASRLAHDALAPLVRRRFDTSDAPGQRARRVLENRAVEWQTGEIGLPLDRQDLALVEAGEAGMRSWTEVEQRLVETSRQEEKKRRRRERLVRIFLIGAVLLIIAAGGVAGLQWISAERQAAIARSRQLAANAIAQLPSDPELSVLLAAESANVWHTAQTEEALRQSLLQTHAYATLSTRDPMNFLTLSTATVKEAMFSPDSRYILGVFDCVDEIWNIETRQLVAELNMSEVSQEEGGFGVSCSLSDVAAYSPTGRFIVSSYTDGAVGKSTEVWETRSGHKVATFEPVGAVWGADFSPDEEFVVTAEGSLFSNSSNDWAMARIWRISTGEVIGQLHEPTASLIEGVEFSPQGDWILTTSSGTARIWDWKSAISLSMFNYRSFSPLFSSDGHWLLAAVDDHTARILNPASGETITEFDHGSALSYARFSPDDHFVITVGGSLVRIWQATTGASLAEIRSFGDELQVIGFSPDSKHLLTIEGKLAQVWEAGTGKLISLLAGHTDRVITAAFSPNSEFVVTAGKDHVARVWATSTGALLAELRGHTSDVIGAAFSGDGKWIVTTSKDDTVRLWDATTIKLVPELRGHTGGLFGLWDIAISPDSRYAITVNGDDARVWELTTGRAGQALRGAVEVKSASFSPNGRLVALQGDKHSDRTSQIVEWETGRNLAALGGILYHVDDAVLSADGESASISGAAWPNGSGNVLYTWDLNTGRRLTTTLPVSQLLSNRDSFFTPDGRFAFGSSGLWKLDSGERVADLEGGIFSSDRSLLLTMKPVATLWNAQSWQKKVELSGYSGTARIAKFSHNATLLMTADYDDKNVLIWDTSSGKRLTALSHDSEVNDASFSFDDSLVVTASDDNIARVWNGLTGEIVTKLTAPTGPLDSVEFSTNGEYVVTASRDDTVLIWDTATWKILTTVTGSGPVFSPNGKSLITWDDANALVWGTPMGNLLFTWELVPSWESFGMGGLEDRPRFSPDSKFVAIEGVSYQDDRLTRVGYRVWSMETGHEFAKSDGPIIAVNMEQSQALLLNATGEAQVWNFRTDELKMALGGEALKPVFSPDSQLVATVGGNAAQLWKATTGQPLHALHGHTDLVNSVQFSFDGQSLVTASDDHTARIWDRMTGHTLFELTGHTARVTNAMFSPDKQTIITVSDDGTARVWSIRTGEQVRLIEYAGPLSPHSVSELSPNGQLLIILVDKSMSIWEVNSGRKVAIVENPSQSMPSFSPDSRWMAFADKLTVLVVETSSGRLAARLFGHTDDVVDVAFAYNGQYLATTSEDGTARIYPLETFQPYEGLVELAHARVSRRFTCDERKTYVDEGDACSTQLAAAALLDQGGELARNGDVEGAAAKFEQALTLDETLRIEPKTEARRIAIDALSRGAKLLASKSDVEGATAMFNQALQLDPGLGIDPLGEARRYALKARVEELISKAESGDSLALDAGLQTAFLLAEPPPNLPANLWDELCRLGAINGYADQVVKGACESAVSAAGLAGFRDSRGLARALTGDTQGAIEDFEFYVKWAEETNQGGNVDWRREWLAALKAGKNPFDAATLEQLHNE